MFMSEVSITFLGAAETVTGSRFLVTSAKSSILVDCGMFQGTKEIRQRNWDPFPASISSIDAVVLTHAHLDHSGYLPLIVKQGYKNPIHSTLYTEKLAGLVLRDSAHLQTGDAKFAAMKKYSDHPAPKALYELEDVEITLKLFQSHPFHEKIQVSTDCWVTFYPSGHILGSSFLLLEIADKKLIFTSDMGRPNHPLLSPPDSPPTIKVDAVITESTYGNRLHDTDVSIFAKEINDGIKRGGQILIPAFAIDRTEVILMAIRDLIEKKEIPALPVYVDSPMAIAALGLYREAVRDNVDEIREGISEHWKSQDPFDAGGLFQAFSTEESKALKDIEGSGILISASGMASGGRVVHHLANMLPDPKNSVILVGYQSIGTRGRMLEDGAREVKIHGDWVKVNAHISKVESFSVHADSDELVNWLKKVDLSGAAYIVHGELEGQEVMQTRLEKELNWKAIIPKAEYKYSL